MHSIVQLGHENQIGLVYFFTPDNQEFTMNKGNLESDLVRQALESREETKNWDQLVQSQLVQMREHHPDTTWAEAEAELRWQLRNPCGLESLGPHGPFSTLHRDCVDDDLFLM